MAMFEKSCERSANAIVKESGQVLVLSEETLEKFIEKKVPRRFLSNIIGVLCSRLRLTNSMYLRSKHGIKMAPEIE
jgi:CRP-like cAMP-binding protein